MSRDPSLESAIAHWSPRFYANGVDPLDYERTLKGVETWDQWYTAWSALGEHYERLAEQGLAQGHRVTRSRHLVRAAIAYHFAQFVLFDDLAAKEKAFLKSVACYKAAGESFRPPLQAFEVPFGEITLPAYLRLPPGAAKPPCVVIIYGLDSSREEAHTFGDLFLERGLAVFIFDGPGQGETWYRLKERPPYEEAAGAALDYLLSTGQVDAGHIGVVGYSYGGFLAPRWAAIDPRVRACVSLGGTFDLSHWDRLPPLLQRDFQHFSGAASIEEATQIASTVTLADVIQRLECPLLIIHSRRDGIFPAAEGEKLHAAATCPKELKIYDEGSHCCTNLHMEVRPLIADWLADRLTA